MHIHMDPLGGLSGDMFVAAMLDAAPDRWPAVRAAVKALDLGPEADVRLIEHHDAALAGRRFLVAGEAEHGHHRHATLNGTHHHRSGGEPQPDAHHHRAWSSIRELIRRSGLQPQVEAAAVAIFGLLAEAEAEVHGVAPDAVTFHEVGAVDSIVDIVAAAQLIVLAGPATWSASPLPLGSGRVDTAHGILPVPAPATILLLRGLVVFDDGIAGERVTPTGAAIARHLLLGSAQPGSEPRVQRPRRLLGTGIGFGTRTLPGIANCLRLVVFDEPRTSDAASPYAHRELGVISFEVDDQTAEDLAAGLEHIRALPGVHDALQSIAFGKKGRLATHVQVLAAPDALEDAIAACFEETTTIGLRYHIVQGAALARDVSAHEADGRPFRVKSARRPDGTVTVKAEASDVAAERRHATRARLRASAESVALGLIGAARQAE